MSSLPGKLDITIQQGDSFDLPLKIRTKLADQSTVPVDLTGHVGKAQIRASTVATEVMAEFTVTITDGAQGELTASLTPGQTTAITGNGVWDLETTAPDGEVRTWVGGNVTLLKEVTR